MDKMEITMKWWEAQCERETALERPMMSFSFMRSHFYLVQKEVSKDTTLPQKSNVAGAR